MKAERGRFRGLVDRIAAFAKRSTGPEAESESEKWIAGRNFGDLFDLEYARIEGEKPVLPPGPDPWNRRWRRIAPKRDLFGLALSGGGIRSATFNLGLLQGLDRLGLLSCLDYVSTVSGGGYIGGFWTAWRHHLHHPEDRPAWSSRLDAERQRWPEGRRAGFPRLGLFPRGDGEEPWPIRNLREFSNFLSPRVGVLSSDFGRMVVAALAAMIPCLLATIALIFLVFATWLLMAMEFAATGETYGSWLATASGIGWSVVLLTLFTVWVLVSFEATWRRRETGARNDEAVRRSEGEGDPSEESPEESHPREDSASETPDPYAGGAYAVATLFALASVVLVVPWVRMAMLGSGFPVVPEGGGEWAALLLSLLAAASGWAVPAVGYLVLRSVLGRGSDGYETTRARAARDRVAGRLLLLTSIWSVFSLIWVASVVLYQQIGIGTVGLTGGLFAAVTWLATGARKRAERLLRTVGTGDGLPTKLRMRLPSLLAYGAIGLLLLGVGLGAVGYVEGALPWWTLIVCLATVAFAGAYMDPNRVGLHHFYKGRIARAFLGAANPHAGYPPRRHTEELRSDDIRLRELQPYGPPLHLVCAAANDLAPVDPLRNLGRGARSAVFSPVGYQVHNEWRRWQDGDDLHLSSVLTASGAAINPMMGRFSRALGRGVTFLMASCGLRLGLWLKHPTFEMSRPEERLLRSLDDAAPEPPRHRSGVLHGLKAWRRETWRSLRTFARRVYPVLRESSGGMVQGVMAVLPILPIPASSNGWAFPGRLHFKELFGSSDAEAGDLNISDGGHFENLALYELIRRHCRYVIVSDCGADPKTAFGDLANLIRRVRQDFGVEVQIDLSPLEPSDRGFARQRVVAGDILYPDGDVGVLLVFKPALLGDEPGDILQYRKSDAAFPQQATYDQFYDEAQWESYRRLGEFAALRAFSFMEPMGAEARESAAEDRAGVRARAGRSLAEARFQWLPKPPDFMERHAKAALEIARLEGLLHENGGLLLDQVFKELSEVRRGRNPAAGDGDGWRIEGGWPNQLLAMEEKDVVASLRLMRQALQVMQETFHLLDLEQRYSDPVNLGVVNYFARWASAPLFHLWWPLLKTMQEPGFVRFMERRFNLPSWSPGASNRRVGTVAKVSRLGFAGLAWLQLRDAAVKDGVVRLENGRPVSVENVFEFSLDLPYRLQGDDNGFRRRFELQAALLDASPIPTGLKTRAWFWRDIDLFVPAGLWGVGIGENFIRAFTATVEEPCVVAVTAESGPRRSREALLYKGAGFVEATAASVVGVVITSLDGSVVSLPPAPPLKDLDGDGCLWLAYVPEERS